MLRATATSEVVSDREFTGASPIPERMMLTADSSDVGVVKMAVVVLVGILWPSLAVKNPAGL